MIGTRWSSTLKFYSECYRSFIFMNPYLRLFFYTFWMWYFWCFVTTLFNFWSHLSLHMIRIPNFLCFNNRHVKKGFNEMSTLRYGKFQVRSKKNVFNRFVNILTLHLRFLDVISLVSTFWICSTKVLSNIIMLLLLLPYFYLFI